MKKAFIVTMIAALTVFGFACKSEENTNVEMTDTAVSSDTMGGVTATDTSGTLATSTDTSGTMLTETTATTTSGTVGTSDTMGGSVGTSTQATTGTTSTTTT